MTTKEGYTIVGIQIPEKLAKAVQHNLKGKISKIAQRAFESALGINGELIRARAELEEATQKMIFLQGYVKELEEDKRNAPKRYRTIC